MLGFQFHATRPDQDKRSPFERLLELFTEVVTHTSGDVKEAMDWMRALDDQHGLTDEEYTLDDFYEELKAKGYLRGGHGSRWWRSRLGLTWRTAHASPGAGPDLRKSAEGCAGAAPHQGARSGG